MNYEAVIGLEVHVQVRTNSKMFSRTAALYGQPENTLTDPVVLGLPGALPVMNKAALDQTVKAGLMLGCEIAAVCKWDRKNYFYPDSPKNYQISQYDQPLCKGGFVEIDLYNKAEDKSDYKKIALTRIHLEEDVGKLSHSGDGSLIDFNRTGTPLMEIVSEPVLSSSEEAYLYLTALKMMMIYGGISDCDMEKGQLRCDANISIRPAGTEPLGTKVELKNLNSISFVRDGIAHEIRRQLAVVERGGTIVQETRDYDGQTGKSQSLRSKEMAHDYRYFPDPDLMPVMVNAEWIKRLESECPERPYVKKRRLAAKYMLPHSITSVLIPSREWCDIFEEEAMAADPIDVPAVANLIVNFFRSDVAKNSLSLVDFRKRVGIGEISKLAKSIRQRVILSTAVASVSSTMVSASLTIDAIVAKEGLSARADQNELEHLCREAIAANPKSRADFKSGKDSAINGFKGYIMRAAKGRADPKLVDATLRRQLAED